MHHAGAGGIQFPSANYVAAVRPEFMQLASGGQTTPSARVREGIGAKEDSLPPVQRQASPFFDWAHHCEGKTFQSVSPAVIVSSHFW